MSKAQESFDDYWKSYARAFSHPFQTDGLLSDFVTNPAITGAYAEAYARSTINSMLSDRFRVSTGAVIRACDKMRDLRKVPQCDVIVWDPS